MNVPQYDMTVHQGSDYELSVTLQEEDGNPIDLTGYEARSQMRPDKDSETVTADFVCTVQNAAEGRIVMSLNNSVTKDIPASSNVGVGRYVYDLEIFTTGDASVRRVLQGEVLVTREVTRV